MRMRINDNSRIDGSTVLSQIPKLSHKISNKTLSQLETEGIFVFPESLKYTEDLSNDQFILQKINDFYYTGNVMGFIGYGNERLTISSRFAKDGKDFFLQYMLEKVLECPNVFDLETEANDNNRLINILIFLFPFYLKSAMRKGLFKNYIHVEYNDSNPKGTINIARHIKQNTPFLGNIAYDQREQSLDNYMSELIRHTIEYIKEKPSGKNILSRVKDEVSRIIEVTPKYKRQDRQKILIDNKKHTVRHAYFTEYRTLQRLCILILQHQKQELGTGINRVYGVLFDGAWLWEEYVNTLVNEHFYHPKNKSHSGAQQLFSGMRKVGLIYPDFIGKDPDNRIIADAKYKPVENIGNHDYLQLLAYMFRFDAKRGIYFYPEASTKDEVILYLNKGSTYEKVEPRDDIYIKKHGLKIPNDAENYKKFVENIQKSEEDFKKQI